MSWARTATVAAQGCQRLPKSYAAALATIRMNSTARCFSTDPDKARGDFTENESVASGEFGGEGAPDPVKVAPGGHMEPKSEATEQSHGAHGGVTTSGAQSVMKSRDSPEATVGGQEGADWGTSDFNEREQAQAASAGNVSGTADSS